MRYFYQTLLSFFFLLPFLSSAQTNYKPGYLITLTGDSIRGFIDYREWDSNPSSITYKKTLISGSPEEKSSQNTSAFGIDGLEYFQLFTLPLSQAQVDLNKLATHPDTTTKVEAVFLKLLAKGKYITLYKYTDNIKARFFISGPGQTQPAELIYNAYYNPDAASSVQYINRYRAQLQYAAQQYNTNSPQLGKQIANANYNEPDLIKIAQLINGSTGSSQQAGPKVSGSQWFAGLGVNNSELKLTQTAGTSTGNGTVNTAYSLFPTIRAGINFIPNVNTKRLLIRAEVSLTSNKYNITVYNTGSTQSVSHLNFKQFTPAIIPQIQYNFYSTKALQVFASAGAAVNFSFYNQYQYITTYSSSFANYVQSNYPDLSKLWVSFPLRAGVVLNNKIEISVCYIPSSSLTSNNVAVSANTTAYQAGITYIFGH
jgi:hypothetical protein